MTDIDFPVWVKTTACNTSTRKVGIRTTHGIIWEYRKVSK